MPAKIRKFEAVSMGYRPDDFAIMDDQGRDWTWAFVIYHKVPKTRRIYVGSDGSAWSRWEASRRIPRGKWRRLVPSYDQDGYPVLHPHQGLCIRLGRAIAMAFLGDRPSHIQACHNNSNPDDNRLSNIRWDTALGNFHDRIANETDTAGSKNGRAKITETDIATIFELRSQGMLQREIGERVGLSQCSVSAILSGERWAHVPRP